MVGCFIGTIIGALPGLGPTNGVAILIPLAFTLGLPATPALILLTSVYYGAMYGGRISSILLNIPGDEPALMTTLDGYPMARKGQAGEALALSGIASFVGSFFATWGLVFLAPLLVKLALLFGPAEYFALYTLAFATLGGIASRNQSKAAIAAALGLGIAMVGVDHQTGVPRFSFNNVYLYDGINFLVAIVGLFAISEVFLFLEHKGEGSGEKIKLGRVTAPLAMLKQCWGAMARSTGLGFLAGVLPGAGASLGSFIAYTLEKRISDKHGTFGKGDPRGVAAPEAGNNAAAGGALVPMLALGVPGSGTTAVLLAMLLALNVTPGPLLFQSNPDVVWGLIAALFIANFMLLLMNIPMVSLFVRVLLVPPRFLMPAVAMISFVGIYGVSGSTFDLMVMIVIRRARLHPAEARHPAGAGHSRRASRQRDGEEPAPRAHHLRRRPVDPVGLVAGDRAVDLRDRRLSRADHRRPLLPPEDRRRGDRGRRRPGLSRGRLGHHLPGRVILGRAKRDPTTQRNFVRWVLGSPLRSARE